VHAVAGNTATEIEHRLARIEALLSADLDRLGEAVLSASASRLDARLQALADRIDAMAAASATGEPVNGAAALQLEQLTRRLEEVVERLDQLSRSLAT
jgi:hypothetical protein